MHRLLRQLLVLVVSLSLVACTTTRVISQGPEASVLALQQSTALGDPRESVIIVTADGTRQEMRLTSVSPETVIGTSLDQKQPVVIPVSQVQRVEVTEINTRAVVTVLVVALVVAVADTISASNSLARSLSGTPR